MREMAELLLEGLGGKENISSVLPCATRLRVEVKDPDLVQEYPFRKAEVLALIKVGNVVQIVTGPQADQLAQEMSQLS